MYIPAVVIFSTRRPVRSYIAVSSDSALILSIDVGYFTINVNVVSGITSISSMSLFAFSQYITALSMVNEYVPPMARGVAVVNFSDLVSSSVVVFLNMYFLKLVLFVLELLELSFS